MLQMWSQANTSGIKLPEVHGVSKGLDPHTQPERQTIKPIVSTVKEVSQIKSRLGQGRAELRHKTKTQISKPIVQMVEKTIENPQNTRQSHDYTNSAIPCSESKGDSDTKMFDRKMKQDVAREIPI